MTDISISNALHTTVGATQRVSQQIANSQKQLATGRKTKGADPVADSISSSLQARASDLLQQKQSIDQTQTDTQIQLDGLSAISDTLSQIKAVASASQTASPSEQADLQSQFDSLSEQLDSFARDSGISGVDSASLGFSINSVSSVDAAAQQVQAAAADTGASATSNDIQQQFLQGLSNTLGAGAAKLVNSDLNEQAAEAVAGSTRQALSVAAIGIAAQSDRAILQLF
jgi:flagellin-like hook-associated protein FlgL